ncbi:hypothetical protein CGLO_13835 [Colletotrichum gloeosporioides Cg-14]|uniref:Uncharacterized protein n=1 Tax=Colletotrichum gloeosporioides (strain Cg-14) TaxID=1237896 RepID=T0JVN2_COLGC|nr:hypothetical protein CGLO_13835 [Colletotrichum gloeosporioides Cg-14]
MRKLAIEAIAEWVKGLIWMSDRWDINWQFPFR